MALTPPSNQQTVSGELIALKDRLATFMRTAGVPPAAPTAGLPDPVLAGQGAIAFDQTQNIPVWSDGSNWNNALGPAYLSSQKQNLATAGSYLGQNRYVDGYVSPVQTWCGDRGWRSAGGGWWRAFTPTNKSLLLGANIGDTAIVASFTVGDPGFPYVIKSGATLVGSQGTLDPGAPTNNRNWIDCYISLDSAAASKAFGSGRFTPPPAGSVAATIATSTTSELTGSHSVYLMVLAQGSVTFLGGNGINVGGNGAFYYGIVPSQGLEIPGSSENA